MPNNPKASHCHIHEKQEDIGDKPYKVCFECGHVYRTPQEVIDQHNIFINRINSNHPPEQQAPPVVQDIGFCPFCLHDWMI